METKQKKNNILIVMLSLLIAIITLSMLFSSAISLSIKKGLRYLDVRANKDLIVHFIDVGQGDAIAIKFANEQVMLIDAGPKDSQNYLVEYLKDNVLTSSKDLSIDYMVLTHPDIDHSGGMSAIFSEFNVKNFYRPNIASESENSADFARISTLNEYEELIKLSYQESGLNINVIKHNYKFNIGDAVIEIFAPLKIYGSMNEMSPLIKITYQGKSFLFAGDIEGEAEQDMVNEYGTRLNADVLKVSHHGSVNSTSIEFINAVNPQYAIICVGYNIYGHPSMEVVSNLTNAGANVMTTEKDYIRLICDDGDINVLDNNIIHSYTFVEWWIIALILDLLILMVVVKIIIDIIKEKRKMKEKIK